MFSFGVSYAKGVAIIADEYVTQEDVIATIYQSLLRYIDHCYDISIIAFKHMSVHVHVFYLHETL